MLREREREMEGDDLDDNQSGDEFLCSVCVSGRYSLASQCAIFSCNFLTVSASVLANA